MELKLDYSLETAEERTDLVRQIVETAPAEQLTPKYLEILSDYIIFAMNRQERKEKSILTDNRLITVNKRETSYQGLVGRLENGEDGIYNMITNDKNIIFMPKVSITSQDLEEIPELRQLRIEIEKIEQEEKSATGKRKFLLRKQLIEMRQNQYIIKTAHKSPVYCTSLTKNFTKIDLSDDIYIDENGEPRNRGLISFFNPEHISALLCNYSKLKEEAWGNFESDSWYLMEDLDVVIDRALETDAPMYYDLLIYKIDGKSNQEIQELLLNTYGVKHSVEYISSLWRNKIPKMIAEQAQADYLTWHYTKIEPGKWKKCSRCGQIKLAHNKFFSKNKTSKDGLYSICKKCRNLKTKKKIKKE